MRLFLLPISTRRTLLYCQSLKATTSEQKTLVDKATVRAAKLWSDWEKKESGWQKKIVDWGNVALKRIPYEEWGLKSVPPLSTKRKEEALKSNTSVEVSFPKDLIPENKVQDVLRQLGTERQALHKSRLMWCFIGMPISAPFALVPIIPNLPFFYLCYRAWSHWRALSGSKHIMFLLEKSLIAPKASSILEGLYSVGVAKSIKAGTVLSAASLAKEQDPSRDASSEQKETMVLTADSAKLVAEALEVPELEVELDRAIWQVEQSMKKDEVLKEEKASLDKANAESKVEAATKEQKKEM